MYAPPQAIPVAPVRPRGLTSAPTLAISCLLLILFLIAATIVLALIPVYTPRKGNANNGNTLTYPFIGSTSRDLGNDGNLNGNTQNNLANGVNSAVGLNSGTTSTRSAALATTAGGRRRRRAYGRSRSGRAQTEQGLQQMYCYFGFDRKRCGPRCSSPRFVTQITVIVVTVTITNIDGTGLLITYNSVTISFRIVLSGILVIPPFQSSRTTSTLSTASTTTSSSTSSTSAAVTSGTGGPNGNGAGANGNSGAPNSGLSTTTAPIEDTTTVAG